MTYVEGFEKLAQAFNGEGTLEERMVKASYIFAAAQAFAELLELGEPLYPVLVTAPAIGDILEWDGTNWVNAAPGGGSDPLQGSYAPGSFTVVNGKFALIANELRLAGGETVTLEGDSCLRIV